MTIAGRVAAQVLASDTPLDDESVRTAARAVLAREAPLAPNTVIDVVVDDILGMGPLGPLLRDPGVADILVNGSGEVYVERGGHLELVDVRFESPDGLVAAVERIVAPLGLRLDHASPMVDARLPDGSRLHASIPPVSIDGPVLAVRRFTQVVPDFDALVRAGAITEVGRGLLESAVRCRRTILVSGGTGTGKTTLLNVLSTAVPAGERIVTIEDAAELRLTGHVVRLEARPPNTEGVGQVTIRDLLRSALRLRPDRILVGEVRGPEAYDLIGALNTGHAGSMSTVHANSPEEALTRLEMLALSHTGTIDHGVIARQLRTAVDLVVQLGRREGRRVVLEVAEVTPTGLQPVYRW